MTNEQYYDCIRPYQNACQIMRAKLEVLNGSLYQKSSVSPIHNIQERIKSKRSIEKKLEKLGYSDSVQNAKDHLRDIAGIRVICYFIDDIYNLVNALKRQSELIFIREKDYIQNPKPNGYRSLHIIVKVPVYFLDRKQYVPVEIQLRTIAMDFWASLEHTLKYKQDAKVEGIDMFDDLKDCSDIIQDVERRMQILMHAVQTSDVEEAASRRRAQIEEQEKVVAGVADAASGKPERAISSSTKTVTEAAVQRSISDAAAVREKTE